MQFNLNLDLSLFLVEAVKDIKNAPGGRLEDILSGFTSVFRTLSALGALIFIVTRFFEDQSAGRPLDINRYVKPFTYIIFLSLYTQVIGVIDEFFGTMEKATYDLSGDIISTAASTLGPALISALNPVGLLGSTEGDTKGTPDENAIMKEVIFAGSDVGAIGGVAAGVAGPSQEDTEVMRYEDQKDVKNEKDIGALTGIMETMGSIISPVTKITAYLILILLYATGPIAIGLSLFPTLDGSIKQWIGLYVKVSLWPMLSNLLSALVMRIMTDPKILLVLIGQNMMGSGMSARANTLLFATVLVAHSLVPRIASALVSVFGFESASPEGQSKYQQMLNKPS
jgi:hypothetical protein